MLWQRLAQGTIDAKREKKKKGEVAFQLPDKVSKNNSLNWHNGVDLTVPAAQEGEVGGINLPGQCNKASLKKQKKKQKT